MSYKQILYHIVLRTKYCEKTISQQNVIELYKYILGIILNHKGVLYRINGIEDHIHLLTNLHPSVSLSNFIKNIKVSTSIWMKQSNYFPDFIGWEEGYGAFTCSYHEKEKIIRYIINQQEHHSEESTNKEYEFICNQNGIDINDNHDIKSNNPQG